MKKEMRKEILEKRNMLSKEEIANKSKIIARSLINLDSYKKSKTMFCFLSFGSEVDTKIIIEDALSNGKNVYVPYIHPEESIMYPVLISAESKYVKNNFGILEPAFDAMATIPPDFDLAIVPGVAFDNNGFRIGYGKGYYDRFFESYSVRNKIGIAFALQLVPSVPKEEHDIPVNIIITEENVLTIK